MYTRFDAIAACSQGCADAFLQVNPALREKVHVVPNCHRFDQIQKLAQAAPVSLPQDRVNVVTVARLGKEKGVERAVRAIAGLAEAKNKLHYYIVGDGWLAGVALDVLRDTSRTALTTKSLTNAAQGCKSENVNDLLWCETAVDLYAIAGRDTN
jgi:glycosyltransferase involved in cell wall biosynthesis